MKNKKGFSLIELMVVLVIIGILAMFILPKVQRARIESTNAIALTTLDNIKKSLEVYYVQHSAYPSDINDLIVAGYLREDYFNGVYRGYTYFGKSFPTSYLVIAKPVNKDIGLKEFTLMTGGIIK